MTSSFCLLTSEDLLGLAAALRSGRLSAPFSALAVRRYVPGILADRVALELRARAGEGGGAEQLADFLEILCEDRGQRQPADDLIDLVWTGPEAPGAANRDTSVVLREMFRSAEESVLLAGYAVYQGQVVFKELADRMEQNPRLDVTMLLDIRRPLREDLCTAEIVRLFAERFARREWPGRRLPRVYYDPRSLDADPRSRASLHAKCVVVDGLRAFVSSANFTGAAQTKNIEVGVLIRSPSFARRLSQHFEALADLQFLKPVPLGG